MELRNSVSREESLAALDVAWGSDEDREEFIGSRNIGKHAKDSIPGAGG
jgi:hypothetical protein